MRIWLGLLVVVGCKTDETRYPIIPGGGGGGGGGLGHDAAVDSRDASGATIAGQVCAITDARDLVTCPGTGAAGLAVVLGNKATHTAADGTFVIDTPQGTNLEWQVSGTAVTTTEMAFSAATTIPVLTAATYADLESGNGVLEVQGEGAILARIVQGGAPAVQAKGATNPIGGNSVFYDSNSVSQWSADSETGPHGVLWAPNLPVGGVTLTVTPMSGAPQLVAGIPIIDRGITYVVVELP